MPFLFVLPVPPLENKVQSSFSFYSLKWSKDVVGLPADSARTSAFRILELDDGK